MEMRSPGSHRRLTTARLARKLASGWRPPQCVMALYVATAGHGAVDDRRPASCVAAQRSIQSDGRAMLGPDERWSIEAIHAGGGEGPKLAKPGRLAAVIERDHCVGFNVKAAPIGADGRSLCGRSLLLNFQKEEQHQGTHSTPRTPRTPQPPTTQSSHHRRRADRTARGREREQDGPKSTKRRRRREVDSVRKFLYNTRVTSNATRHVDCYSCVAILRQF